jgi:16S rRNA (guanine527-N7)-methyltransferase
MLNTDIAKKLTKGLMELALSLSEQQQQQLLNYLELLLKWNASYNLTAIRDAEDMLVKHLFDALAVESYLPIEGHWLDVGSGAGVPGLLLAIVNPHREWTLLDSNGKKTRFLTQAVIELGLQNRVSVVHKRAEAHEGSYDGIIARAVMDTGDFIRLTEHLCASDGAWWLMKGAFPSDELAHLPDGVTVTFVDLIVPELQAERCLIKAIKNR